MNWLRLTCSEESSAADRIDGLAQRFVKPGVRIAAEYFVKRPADRLRELLASEIDRSEAGDTARSGESAYTSGAGSSVRRG